MPVRPMPMTYEVKGKHYFVERPIATQKSAFTLVAQLRNWLPDAIGGVMYYNCDDANMVAYVPVYCGTTTVPEAFRRENNNYKEFSEKSAFWMNNFVANMVYPRYSVIMPDLRNVQTELEDYYAAQVKIDETKAPTLLDSDMIAYINNKVSDYTSLMMERWDKLARLIIVKHNDQVVYENGQISSPGYNASFYEQITKDTGDRYEMKNYIERRER